MGAVSQAAVQSGADVIGIIPRTMTSSPPRGHSGGSTPAKSGAVSGEGTGATVLNPDAGQGRIETEVVESMHERKERMANLSDGGFIGLPGGFGTFEESESLTCALKRTEDGKACLLCVKRMGVAKE